MSLPIRQPLLFALAAAAIAGCSDYGVAGKDKDGTPGNGQSAIDTAMVTLPVDACSEELPDYPGLVAVDEECRIVQDTGALDVVNEWSAPGFAQFPDYAQILMTPVVGHLTDDNGDGLYDHNDTPDIVVVTDKGVDTGHGHGLLRIVDGAAGTVYMTLEKVSDATTDYHPYQYSNVAIGDIDNDGIGEIVFIAEMINNSPPEPPDTAPPPDSTLMPDDSGGETGGETGENPVMPEDVQRQCAIVAVEHDFQLKWALKPETVDCGSHAPALADLEADREVEVIVGGYIIEGASGTLRNNIGQGVGVFQAYPEIGYTSFATDLDGDGVQEVVTGRSIHDSEGGLVCELAATYHDGAPAAADFDGDGLGEVVVSGDNMVVVFDSSCNVVYEFPLAGTGNGGPPTIADFDGDSTPEIGVAGADHYAVYEVDGTTLWSVTATDESSHATGSSVFDFEGDGLYEVLYSDETSFRILAGPTGATRFEDTNHASRTLHEYPIVVDVDGDGEAEILSIHGGGHNGDNSLGMDAWGSGGDPWEAGRQVWNQHAYSITNVEEDLTIPPGISGNWPEFNSFRSGSTELPDGGREIDTVPIFGASCTEDCAETGEILVLVRLGNGGLGTIPAGTTVALYWELAEGNELIATATSTADLLSGQSTAPIAITVDITGREGETLLLVSDDIGTGEGIHDECDETNNELRLVAECEEEEE